MNELTQLREALSALTQSERKELAERLGIPWPTVQKIATGNTENPTYSTVAPLLRHFELGPFKVAA